MEYITVVDAMMGRGKSSAAIQYMQDHASHQRFLYITPFLKEVDRICEFCEFDQPEAEKDSTKSADLMSKLARGESIASTHALFYLLDSNALEIIRAKHYTLIVDESIEAITKVQISKSDYELVLGYLTEIADDGKVVWKNDDYSGSMWRYKRIADAGWLYCINHELVQLPSPDLFRAFDRVYMLTYLFKGQYQSAYFDFFGIPYEIVGVERDSDGFRFSNRPDCPPPTDFKSLIRVLEKDKLNDVGKSKHALSKTWYEKRGADHPDMVRVRRNMDNYFRNISQSSAEARLWTCFKESASKLEGQNKRRYKPSFLQISARATNEYRDRTVLAYMVNRFADPGMTIFFRSRNCFVNEDLFALSSMLQWIWRSAIRDGREINIYLPSRRMRDLLYGWMDRVAEGGEFIA